MKEEPPKQLRVRTVGTKLTDREYAQCEKSAARRGQTLSEWCRQVLLAAVESPAQRPEDEAILSEILAVRKIVDQPAVRRPSGRAAERRTHAGADRGCRLGKAPQSSGTPRSPTNSMNAVLSKGTESSPGHPATERRPEGWP